MRLVVLQDLAWISRKLQRHCSVKTKKFDKQNQIIELLKRKNEALQKQLNCIKNNKLKWEEMQKFKMKTEEDFLEELTDMKL